MKGYIRVGGAVVLGAVVITAALYLRPTNSDNGSVAIVNSTERQYIQPDDLDNNSVPDWQEEIQKRIFETTPNKAPDVSNNQLSDTFTDKFARSFFQDFIEAKTPGAPPRTQEEFLNAAVSYVEQSSESKLYTRKDITTGSTETSETALRAYGNAVAEIINRYSMDNENEALILSRSLEANDPTMLEKLKPIQEVYEHIISDTLEILVPETLTKQHLDLVNSYQAILTDIEAMQQVYNDPLYTMARMKRYQDDVNALTLSLFNIHTYLKKTGILYADDEPGAFFYIFSS